MPELTVAIPAFNGARHIAQALRSILDQRGAAFDLLVCDDRSDDATLKIVRETAGDRAQVVVNPERLGLAGNWNRCVERSRTEWVAVFHQDDLMRPGHLAGTVAAVTAWAGSSAGWVAAPAEAIDEDGDPVPADRIEPGFIEPPHDLQRRGAACYYPPGSFLPELAIRNPVRCSAVVLRKAAHAEVGGFDPSYRYAVDWDFWIRLSARWGTVWRQGPPTVAFRWHASSETHRFRTGTLDLEESERLLDALYREHGASWPDRGDLRRAADRRLSRAYLNRAYDAAHAGDRRLSLRCLRRALDLWPGIIRTIVSDPRLMARLALARRIDPKR